MSEKKGSSVVVVDEKKKGERVGIDGERGSAGRVGEVGDYNFLKGMREGGSGCARRRDVHKPPWNRVRSRRGQVMLLLHH